MNAITTHYENSSEISLPRFRITTKCAKECLAAFGYELALILVVLLGLAIFGGIVYWGWHCCMKDYTPHNFREGAQDIILGYIVYKEGGKPVIRVYKAIRKRTIGKR